MFLSSCHSGQVLRTINLFGSFRSSWQGQIGGTYQKLDPGLISPYFMCFMPTMVLETVIRPKITKNFLLSPPHLSAVVTKRIAQARSYLLGPGLHTFSRGGQEDKGEFTAPIDLFLHLVSGFGELVL